MMDQLARQIDMLARHLEVMQLVVASEPIGMVKMADETGFAQHEIRYSLRVLENESLIEPSPHGATTMERTNEYISGFDDNIDALGEQFGRIHVERTTE